MKKKFAENHFYQEANFGLFLYIFTKKNLPSVEFSSKIDFSQKVENNK